MKLSAQSFKSVLKTNFQLSTFNSQLSRGFTLIELLVVIGILGILAAALVATIDPFEQIRKGEDARTQNLVVEYQTALTRYYTTHLKMPWEGPSPACEPVGAGVFNLPVDTTLADLSDCTDVLITEGELKQAFNTAQGLDKVYIIEPYIITGTTPAQNSSTAVCYQPVSKSGRVNENARYDRSGTVQATTTCPSEDAGTICHWCAE